MSDGLHDIARARFTLSAYHRSTLGNTAQSFSEISRTADKRYFELPLINVVNIVGRRKDFALVDIVDLYCFKYLRFHKVTNTAFCHNGNRNSFLNRTDHSRIAHS